VLAILLAALSAAVWGTGDFCGGKASQRADALAVTVLSQLAGLPVLAACLVIYPAPVPGPGVWMRSGLAGCAGFLGIVVLYRGLAQGAMAIFAPVSAVTAALVPMGVGLVLDRRPSTLALVGAVCAIVAIGLVSLSGTGGVRVTPRLIGLALASGALFGIFFSLLGKSGADAGVWPMVAVRAGSISLGLAFLLRQSVLRRRAVMPRGAALAWTVTAGPADILANVLYLVAAGGGLLSVIAPVASLYPASTVLLAYLVDRERVRPVQLAGLGLAATALLLVAT
jgi:drug/metabolite transporter (DMT)-like permease